RGVGVAVRSELGDATEARFIGGIVSAAEAASRPRFADAEPVVGDCGAILDGIGWPTRQAQADAEGEDSNLDGTERNAQLVRVPSTVCVFILSLTDL
ncbi:MAG: hypothetical protein ACKPKO_20120, partial [Candidatus Fonsibacter sp.]